MENNNTNTTKLNKAKPILESTLTVVSTIAVALATVKLGIEIVNAFRGDSKTF